MAEPKTVTLSWTANTEPDLAGYRVYFGLVSGVYLGVAQIANPLAVSVQYTLAKPQTNATIPWFSVDGRWYFAISAYDTSGNEGSLSTPQNGRLIAQSSRLILRR